MGNAPLNLNYLSFTLFVCHFTWLDWDPDAHSQKAFGFRGAKLIWIHMIRIRNTAWKSTVPVGTVSGFKTTNKKLFVKIRCLPSKHKAMNVKASPVVPISGRSYLETQYLKIIGTPGWEIIFIIEIRRISWCQAEPVSMNYILYI